MPSRRTRRRDHFDKSAEVRLDSWKEIASYLKRGVRTVQRWEKEEGLPVRRHLHGKQSSVYAYKCELEAWWNGRRAALEREEGAAVPRGHRRVLLLATLALLLLVAGWLFRVRSPAAILIVDRPWVLVTTFENRTGNERLDGTVQYALEYHLTSSHSLNVVPRPRVNDVLRLMRKPIDSPIDGELGREICLRDGGIGAVVTGRVERIGETYILTAALVRASDGVTLESYREEADEDANVSSAIRRLAVDIGGELGEDIDSWSENGEELLPVSTPSLLSLKLYSQANALMMEGRPNEAEGLLRRAIEKDPEFASAHNLLAWSLHDQGKATEEYRRHLERALELGVEATVRERYFIEGSYHQLHGELSAARSAYQAVLHLYPDHEWTLRNLQTIYENLGSPERSLPYLHRYAELRPLDFWAQDRMVSQLVVQRGDWESAEHFLFRSQQLAASAELHEVQAYPATRAMLFGAARHWREGNLQGVRAEVQRVSAALPRDLASAAQIVALAHLALGRLGEAEGWAREARPVPRARLLAKISLARNDLDGLRAHARTIDRIPLILAVDGVLLARAGLGPELRLILDEGRIQRYRALRLDGYLDLLEGELALVEGRAKDAARLIARGMERSGVRGSILAFLAYESLAESHETAGESELALEVLEKARRNRDKIIFPFPCYFWMRTQVRLANLYDKLGRTEEAAAVRSELLHLLRFADPDHPMLAELSTSM